MKGANPCAVIWKFVNELWMSILDSSETRDQYFDHTAIFLPLGKRIITAPVMTVFHAHGPLFDMYYPVV
jgi:hypothetical protein